MCQVSLEKACSNCQPPDNYRPQFLWWWAPHFLVGTLPAQQHCTRRIQGAGLLLTRGPWLPCGFSRRFLHSNIFLLCCHLAASTGKERRALRIKTACPLPRYRCACVGMFHWLHHRGTLKPSRKRKNQGKETTWIKTSSSKAWWASNVLCRGVRWCSWGLSAQGRHYHSIALNGCFAMCRQA